MTTKTPPSIEQIARIFRVTPTAVRRQFSENARQLRNMADTARRTGRRVNGYTEAQLTAFATTTEARAKGV